MPDSPDYQKYLPSSTRFSLQDLGELAVRLDSPDSYDRRGEVVWQEDMRHGLTPWGFTGSGTGAAFELSADRQYKSGYSLHLIAGSDGGHLEEVGKYFSLLTLSRVGFEASIANITEFDHMLLLILSTTAGVVTEAEYFIDRITNQIQIFDKNLGKISIGAINNPISPFGVFHNIKVVADFSTGKYIRCLFDHTEIDVSKNVLPFGASADVDNLQIVIQLIGNAGINSECYIGHAIITSNEP